MGVFNARKHQAAQTCSSSSQAKVQLQMSPLALPPVWFLLPLLLLPLLCLQLLSSKTRSGEAASFAPSPPKLPIFGHLLQLGSRPHRYFRSVSQRYGPVVQLQLGHVPTLVVSSVQSAKEVLRINDLQCCSRPNSPGPRMLTYNLVDVAFAPYSEYWREMRKFFLLELLSMKQVRSFGYARAAEIDRLVESLASSPPGTPVNLTEKLYALADGVLGTVAFGKMYASVQFGKGEFQEVMDGALQVLGSFTFEDFFPSSALARLADVVTGAAGQRRRVFQKIDGFFQAVLEHHLQPGRSEAAEPEDMVDALVKLWREKGEAIGLTHDHIKAILTNTSAGGIDTCAVTTIWAMSELIKNPRVMQKAQAEVRSLLKAKPKVDEDDILNLKYLKMIVKENFRLHPPVTLLVPRETTKFCKIGGYDVMRGTRVFVNVWAMGRDPTVWENPEAFCAERFEHIEVDFRGSDFELLPFGAGRRMCPGLTMGVTNVELTLANLLYCFDWKLPKEMKADDISLEEVGALTFRKKTPLFLVPVKHV